jgi:hypothetical protein
MDHAEKCEDKYAINGFSTLLVGSDRIGSDGAELEPSRNWDLEQS